MAIPIRISSPGSDSKQVSYISVFPVTAMLEPYQVAPQKRCLTLWTMSFNRNYLRCFNTLETEEVLG